MNIIQPPEEIVTCALAVQVWFERNGIKSWRLGNVCSVDYFAKIEAIKAILKAEPPSRKNNNLTIA